MRKHRTTQTTAKQHGEDTRHDPLLKPEPTTEPASRNNDDQGAKVDDLKKVAKHPPEQTTTVAKHPPEAS